MKDDLETQPTVFGGIALAIFLIACGVNYSIPQSFPEGTLYALAGVLILLVSMIKAFKGIALYGLDVIFGVILLMIGVNKLFEYDMGFIPIFFIVIGAVFLFKNTKRLMNGEVFQ